MDHTTRRRLCRIRRSAFPDTRSPTCTNPSGSRRSTSGSAKRSQPPIRPFWAEWDAYRRDAGRAAVAGRRCRTCSSRWRRTSAAFVTRLFDVEPAARGIWRHDTRAGRSLPLQGRLRPPARAAARSRAARTSRRRRPTMRSAVADWSAPRRRRSARERELAIARAGCALLDREKAGQGRRVADADRGAEALVCRAPSRSGVPRTGSSSGFPRTLDCWHLVDVAAAGSRICRRR